jgi:hypothetical protein
VLASQFVALHERTLVLALEAAAAHRVAELCTAPVAEALARDVRQRLVEADVMAIDAGGL